MHLISFAFLALCFLGGCNTPVEEKSTSAPTFQAVAPLAQPVVEETAPAEIVETEKGELQEVEVINVAEKTTLQELSAIVAQKDKESKKVKILYFWAGWCAPCHFFNRSLADDQLKAVMQNAVIFKIDVDHSDPLIYKRFSIASYPSYVKVDGKMDEVAFINGGEWGDDVIENLVPVMDAFVNTKQYNNILHK